MSENNVAIVRNFYDSLSSGDLDNLFTRFSPKIDWREAERFPYSDRNPYTSPAAVADGVVRRIGEDWDAFTITIDRYLVDADTVVMLGSYSGTYRATGKTR